MSFSSFGVSRGEVGGGRENSHTIRTEHKFCITNSFPELLLQFVLQLLREVQISGIIWNSFSANLTYPGLSDGMLRALLASTPQFGPWATGIPHHPLGLVAIPDRHASPHPEDWLCVALIVHNTLEGHEELIHAIMMLVDGASHPPVKISRE